MNKSQIFYHMYCINDCLKRFENTYTKIKNSSLLEKIENLNVILVGPEANKNKEHLKQYIKEYRKNNVDKIRQIKRDYERYRKASDPAYKLISNFRTAIYQVLKENNVEKNKHYFDILKYTPEELISHLEKQFTDSMTWENYGEWHVDHRMPISSFVFESVDDDSFIKCWSLENLQPMWGKDNIVKGNNIIY